MASADRGRVGAILNEGVTARYDLAGRVLAIRAETVRWLDDFDAMLGSLRLAGDGPASFTIEIGQSDSGPPQEGMLVFEGDVPEDGFCRMRTNDGRVSLVFPGSQSIVINLPAGRAEIRLLTPGGRVNWTVWMMALDAAIDAGGQTLLHAAGLRLPDSDDIILIHAPSGTGKTTASLALADAGFGLLSDDAMVLAPASGGWTGWGLPRGVKIHRHTAVMLPRLKAILTDRWDQAGEQAIPLSRLAQIVRVEAPVSRKVAASFHLHRTAGPTRALHVQNRPEMLAALASDNVRVGRTGLLPGQRRRMAALAAFVSSTPLFRLESGSELRDLGPTVRAAIRTHGSGINDSG